MLHFHHAVSKDDLAGIKMVEGSRYTGVDEQLFTDHSAPMSSRLCNFPSCVKSRCLLLMLEVNVNVSGWFFLSAITATIGCSLNTTVYIRYQQMVI